MHIVIHTHTRNEYSHPCTHTPQQWSCILYQGCLVGNQLAQASTVIRKRLSTFGELEPFLKGKGNGWNFWFCLKKKDWFFLVVPIDLERADLPIKQHFTSWSIWCHSHWIKSNWNVIPFPEQIPLQGSAAQKHLTLCWLPRGLSRKLGTWEGSAELKSFCTQPTHLTSRPGCCSPLGQQMYPDGFCWPLQGPGPSIWMYIYISESQLTWAKEQGQPDSP
jgi:hypothetical protein